MRYLQILGHEAKLGVLPTIVCAYPRQDWQDRDTLPLESSQNSQSIPA